MAISADTALSHMKDLDKVRWFRGMSMEQTDACEALNHALRDDLQQKTAHRVRRCCIRLGLDRLVSPKQLKLIMDLSQGNDLAFLWFLWEAHYKRPGRDSSCASGDDLYEYTVNEQLLLSAIAHLDLPSTYCELEKLLPPASCSIKRQAAKRARRLASEYKQALQHKAQQRKSRTYSLPYFAPQPLPKLFSPRKKERQIEMKMIFPRCKQKNNVKIYEEPPRWFASYKLSPSKRIAKKLLTDEIDRMLLDDGAAEKAQARVQCNHHSNMEKLATVKKQQLADETLRRCLFKLDVQESQQKARRQCIEQLEREIEQAAARLQQYKRSQLVEIHKFSGGVQCCRVCSKLTLLLDKEPSRKANLSLLVGMDTSHDGVSRSACGDSCRKTVDPSLMAQAKAKPQAANKRSRSRSRGGSVAQGEACMPQSSRLKGLQHLNDNKEKPHCSRTSPFWPLPMPTAVTPLTSRSLIDQMKMDYFKIFQLPDELQKLRQTHTALEDAHSTASKQEFIEQCCIKALNEPLDEATASTECQDKLKQQQQQREQKQREQEQPNDLLHNSHALMLNAADRCALNIFHQRLFLYESTKPPELPPDLLELSKIDSVDPDDAKQISRLLSLGLKVMRRNPRNVLASFPNADKLPVLLDWVADHYGKMYNQQELNMIARAPEYIYERIARAELPRFKDKFKYKVFESYNKRDEIKCMSDYLRAKYFKEQDDQTMDVARLVWLAMRGYASMGRSITDTYFAYMPSHMLSLYHVLWKSCNYRNMLLIRSKIGSLI